MAKTKKCVVCGDKDTPKVDIKPFGLLCSKCLSKGIDTFNEALDLLYEKKIYPKESKYIMEKLDDSEFDLENYIENHPDFSEQIMFEVVTDMINNEKDKDVVLRLMDAARIKSLGMEFVEYDESE